MKVAVIVAVVIIASISAYAYLKYSSKPRPVFPKISTNNTVVNQTISENFVQEFSGSPARFYANATTVFTHDGVASYLTIKLMMAPYTDSVGGYVVALSYVSVYGTIMGGLNPKQLSINLSDIGPYDNNNTYVYTGDYLYIPPYNVTSSSNALLNNAYSGYGNFSVVPIFNLLNQTASNSTTYYNFGILWEPDIQFFLVNSTSAGNHILHFTASIDNLGTIIWAQVNVLLVDKP